MSAPIFESFAILARSRRAAAAAMGQLTGDWQLRATADSLGEFELLPRGRKLSNGAAWETARRLARQPGILAAEPLFSGPGLQPDPAHLDDILASHERPRITRAIGGSGKHLVCTADEKWSSKAVNAPTAWSTSTGKGVVVGHPDTGYTQHPQIWSTADNRVLVNLGYDFVRGQVDSLDPLTGARPGHGASTASVIMSARGDDDSPQVDGIAPDSQLVPLRVSGSVIHLSFTNLRRALLYIAGKAQVISMSLGGPFPSQALRRALQHVSDLGAVCIAASGNVYPFVVFPARYPEVIAVAATNCQKKRWQWSTHGRAVDFCAPGESVWCAESALKSRVLSYKVERRSGTSYAAAIASGVCALWLAKHGHANLLAKYGAHVATVFREIVMRSGCNVPRNWNTRTLGAGIVDADKVLAAALPARAVVASDAAPRGILEAADFFPMLEPDVAMAAITANVPRTRRGGVPAAFAVAGDELLFQLGSNPRLRETIHERATAGPRKRGTRRKPAPSLDASATFRRAFGF